MKNKLVFGIARIVGYTVIGFVAIRVFDFIFQVRPQDEIFNMLSPWIQVLISLAVGLIVYGLWQARYYKPPNKGAGR